MIITIDGLDGAGKSTLAKSLSEKLGYEYIDKPIYELFNVKVMTIIYMMRYIIFKI